MLTFEGSILLWIQDNLRAGFATPAVSFITRLGDRGMLWIAAAAALLAFRRTRRVGLTCAISMVLGFLLTNLLLKNWTARVRPYEVVQGLQRLVGAQKDFSFPSGHTTNGLACAWVIFRRTPRKYGVPALALAVVIALTRLYVGVHYPTDVLGGAVVGLACAAIALRLEPWLEKKIPAIGKAL